VPAEAKDPEAEEPKVVEKEKSNLKKDLLKEFDTDGAGRISEDEKPPEEQLKQFTKRRGEKPQIDQVDSKRKTRIEAETAVKHAMVELEEARVREELSAREELEAHKLMLGKAKKGMTRNKEEMEKIKQADRSKHEKNEAALAKLKQEQEHGEELIRHTIRAKKAAHLDDEDRVQELDGDLHRLHEKETERICHKEEEDRRGEEESRAAHERYLKRVKADEDDIAQGKEEMEKLKREESALKEELDEKERTFQEKARAIKFDDDDEHSLHEHELDVLQKSNDKLEAQVNIKEKEINDLSARLDARRITQADEKKSDRRQAAAEHEAELMKESLETEETVKIAKPVIDRDQPPSPDLEPSLPKYEKVEPTPPKPEIPDLPVSAAPDLPKPSEVKTVVKDKPSLPDLPKPVAPKTSDDKPALPELPKPDASKKSDDKPALPELPKPTSGRGPALPVLPKPSGSTEEIAEKSALPTLPQPPGEAGDDPKLTPMPLATGDSPPSDVPAPASAAEPKKKGFFGKVFGKKKKEDPQSATPNLPGPPAGDPSPNLPPPSGASKPPRDLPPLPSPAAKPDLPPPPGDDKPGKGEEVERIQIEKKLQQIADDRAERNKDEPDELPALPIPPKASGSKPALPALPKPGGDAPVPTQPSLPKPAGEKPALTPAGGAPKPALPPLPKPGSGSPPNVPPLPKPGGLPPLPGPANIEDEADQQTRDQERDG
jgi:hypothetical protein